MNITENADEAVNGDAFTLISTNTRYSALKNENEIFLTTQNDTTGDMYLSLVQVYPTIKNITK